MFRDKYHELVDAFSDLAINLEISEANLLVLDEQLVTFKDHLFDASYCDARPEILWNKTREHLEALRLLLAEPKISVEKRLDVIINLGPNLLLCSDGVVSHLQEAIQRLVSDSDVIPYAKELLVQQLVITFIQENKFFSLGMEVHYANAFINYFADDLGMNKRLHEQTVTTDNELIQQQAASCWRMLAEKLPVCLVSYLAEEWCSAGRQALQDGGINSGESWQQFLDTSIAGFFKSASIQHALFVEDDEQIGRFAVPKDSRSLH